MQQYLFPGHWTWTVYFNSNLYAVKSGLAHSGRGPPPLTRAGPAPVEDHVRNCGEESGGTRCASPQPGFSFWYAIRGLIFLMHLLPYIGWLTS